MPSEWATRAGGADGVGGAAGALAVVGRVRPELERHRDHLGAALALAQRCDGAVDAAADRDQDALGAAGGRLEQRLAEPDAAAPSAR